MKHKNQLFIMSILIILTLILGACSPGAGEDIASDQPEDVEEGMDASTEPVTISFWHAYNADVEAKFLEETLIPAFESENPDIKVQSVLVPYDQFRRKLLIALSGGTAPDLARVDILWVPELADQGALANMEELWSDFDQFLPGPLSTNLYNGSYYGLPLDTNTRVLVYNVDMFKDAGIAEPPATMADLQTACEKIKELGEDKYCFADGGTYAWAVNPWIWSFGGSVTDPDITTTDGYFNGSETVAAYQFLKDSVDEGYLHPGILGGGVDSWGGFGQDQIAMILEGPWFPAMFEGQFPDKEYGMALLPAGDGGSVSVVGGEDIVLFQQSQKKDAAVKFLEFILSEDVQIQLAATGQMPVLKSAVDSDFVKEHDFFGIFLEQLETAKARTPHPNWSRIEEIMTNTGTAILNGTVGVQDGLNEAVQSIDPLLPLVILE